MLRPFAGSNFIACRSDSEVVHPSADDDAMRRFTNFAREHDLLITGGSDFHAPAPGYAPGIDFAAEHVERLRTAVARAQTAA